MIRNFLFSLLILLGASCSSSVSVTSDYDKLADFAKYKTYAFSQEALKLPIGDLNQARVIAAVETEMAAKGFSKSENPDIIVDILVKAQEKVDATATTSGTGYYGGYGGMRYGYGGGFTTTSINYDEYIEGTMFITFVDVSTQKIVWQGRGTKTIDEDANADKREANINAAIKAIIAEYPPQQK
jgi:hypothetical protein